MHYLLKIIPLTFLTMIALIACTNTKILTKERSMMLTDANTYKCLLIEKELIDEQNNSKQYKALYLRCSVQDYFIQICEGRVTQEQLKPYINKGIEVELQIKQGMIAPCFGNIDPTEKIIQNYVVINKLIK